MNSYNLGGHSGCQILLVEDDYGSVYVRKISKDIAYNHRLKAQCEKQKRFFSLGAGKSIKTPKILKCGYTEDTLYYFEMEYIQGITLAEYIKTMEIGKVKNLVKNLVGSLIPQNSYTMTQEEKIKVANIFSNKINLLRDTLQGKNDIINQSLNLLEIHDWSKTTPSPCHGDMSLENIIVKNDDLYFIDFLDSFYDSWVLDIGTLLQDVQVMWSYRYQDKVSMNTVLRLIVFRDLLLDEIQKIDESYVVEIYYSLLMKLIRIYPYINDEITYQFLNEKTEIVIENIQKLENTTRGVA